MKKTLLCSCLSVLLLTSPAWAQDTSRTTLPPQSIQLKDGTVIKGRLVGVSGDQYVIDSQNLGQLRIKTSQMQSISAADAHPATAPGAQPPANLSLSSPQIPPQVQELGKKMLADPEITARLNALVNDPEIKRLAEDPAILQSALTMDPKQIQNNPKMQQILSNPKMKELMDLVAKKLLPQQGQETPPASP